MVHTLTYGRLQQCATEIIKLINDGYWSKFNDGYWSFTVSCLWLSSEPFQLNIWSIPGFSDGLQMEGTQKNT